MSSPSFDLLLPGCFSVAALVSSSPVDLRDAGRYGIRVVFWNRAGSDPGVSSPDVVDRVRAVAY